MNSHLQKLLKYLYFDIKKEDSHLVRLSSAKIFAILISDFRIISNLGTGI